MTTTNVERLVEELQAERRRLFDQHTTIGEDRFLREFIDGDFLRSKLTSALSQARQEGREEVAKEIAMAGENKISLLDNAGNFTGTYWISLNSLYFHLTGRHVNADWENGAIEKNPTIEAFIRKESALTTEGK